MPNFIHTRVDPNRLSTIANNIDSSIGQVESDINKLQQTLTGNGSGSLKATWTGPASAQFYSKYDVDLETFKSYLKVLKTLNDQLIEAAGFYAHAENNAQELVNNLKIN